MSVNGENKLHDKPHNKPSDKSHDNNHYNFIIDSHCHIHYDTYSNNRNQDSQQYRESREALENREDQQNQESQHSQQNQAMQNLIDRAKNNLVNYMITVGTDHNSHKQILPLIESYSQIFGSVGVHPCDCYKMLDDLTANANVNARNGKYGDGVKNGEDGDISKYISKDVNNVHEESLYDYLMHYGQHDKIVAFGETGLDFFVPVSDKRNTPALQESFFRQHIAASKNTGIPVIIHSRNAEDDTLRILKKENFSNAVFHCFTGSQKMATIGLELGCYISFSGIITFKNCEDLRKIVKNTPLSRILVETDSPYLSPEPVRKIKINEPSHTLYVAKKIAEIHDVSLEEVMETTTQNCLNLFKKMHIIENK